MFKIGDRLTYDDGRPGHQGVQATVLSADADGMTVQFEDRADTTYIRFADRAWMDHIRPATSISVTLSCQP